MNVRALVQRYLLALEVGDALDRAVGLHEDRLAFRCRRLMGDVDERRACSLCEDRRCFTGRAEVDGANVQPFEKLRSCRKLRPFDGETKRLQGFLQRALALEQDERAVFLKADPQHVASTCRSREAGLAHDDRCCTSCKQPTAGDGDVRRAHVASHLSIEIIDKTREQLPVNLNSFQLSRKICRQHSGDGKLAVMLLCLAPQPFDEVCDFGKVEFRRRRHDEVSKVHRQRGGKWLNQPF